MVEQLRARGARFEGDVPAASDPFQSLEVQQGGFWRAGVDDEATSIFSPDQIEDAARRARSKSLVPEMPPARPPTAKPQQAPRISPPARPSGPPSVPGREAVPADLRRVPDHGPTGMFPFAEPPTQKPAPAPAASGGFEEEPTALFMADGEVNRVDLRQIPDHGRTGMVYPVSRDQIPPRPLASGSSPVGRASSASTAAPPPSMPAAASPVGRASPAGMEAPAPSLAPPVRPAAPPVRPAAPLPPPPPASASPARSSAPIVVERPVTQVERPSSPVSSMVPIDIVPPTPASSMEPMAASQPANADQAFPETASGVRRGATLDEIMRLKVQAPPPEPGWKRALPKVALGVLVLLAIGAVLAVIAAVATIAFQ